MSDSTAALISLMSVCAFAFALVIIFSVVDSNSNLAEWTSFSRAHHCRVTEVRRTRHDKAYICDDGITYWREDE